MPNGPPPPQHGWVSRIELNEGGETVDVYVYILNFTVGQPVEISGCVTQDNGTIANFYDVRRMGKPAVAGQGVTMLLKGVRVAPPNGFDQNQPITVVARAADAWITTLMNDGKPISPELTKLQPKSNRTLPAWNADETARPSHSAWSYLKGPAQKGQPPAQGQWKPP